MNLLLCQPFLFRSTLLPSGHWAVAGGGPAGGEIPRMESVQLHAQ